MKRAVVGNVVDTLNSGIDTVINSDNADRRLVLRSHVSDRSLDELTLSNLGIGTNNPGAKLEIDGQRKVDVGQRSFHHVSGRHGPEHGLYRCASRRGLP